MTPIRRASLLLFLTLATAAAGNEESHGVIAPTASRPSIFDGEPDPLSYGIEYRFNALGRWRLTPVIGITTAEDDASFAYVDVRRDFTLTEHWLITPSFGAGRFDPDGLLDLGHPLEFRSGVLLTYRFDNDWRVEAGIFHFSNGGLSDKNPGTEALTIALGIPLGKND